MSITKEQQDFIAQVGALSAVDMGDNGILASLTVAQAILESGWGKSVLALKANALFGIKAGADWKGRVFNSKTQECYDGVNFTEVDAAFRAYDSWEQSVTDHSAFLTGKPRYAVVVGETDYKTACAAIKAAGYATVPAYAEKLISIIETYDLTAFDAASGKEGNKMNLYKLIFINNACYKAGKTITPQGIMVHSTGANNPNLKRYVGPDDGLLGKNQYNNHWNQDTPDGRQVCVHGFIGKLADGSIATYQTLPWNHRGWHAGGTANNTHIGFEICEDGLTDASYFRKVFNEAVELCVMLCKQYGLNETNIICHSEGYTKGIASNHGDVMHWFPKHGENMGTFRAAVKKAFASGAATAPAPDKPAAPAPSETLYRVRKSWSDSKSQKGAFKVLDNAKRCADENAGYSVYDEKGGVVYSGKIAAPAYDTYTVVKGDSLWKIAAVKLGNGARYPEIKQLNGLTSDTIYAGQVFKIPKK
jgi:LysM repeat protein